MKKRCISRLFFACLFFLSRASSVLAAEYYFDASASIGSWKKGVVAGREAVFTSEGKSASELEISVPSAGRYQLFAYVYHDWPYGFPDFRVEARDALGRYYVGSHAVENIWYLGPHNKGRWFFVSLSSNPFWELPEGKLKLAFSVTPIKEPWSQDAAEPGGLTAVEGFFLLPVISEGEQDYILYPKGIETGSGKWNVLDYSGEYATGMVSSGGPGRRFGFDTGIPRGGRYSVILCILCETGSRLRISFDNGKSLSSQDLTFPSCANWQVIQAEPVHLDKGDYKVVMENITPGKLSVDYAIIVPDVSSAAFE